jgi:hypothetical protein
VPRRGGGSGPRPGGRAARTALAVPVVIPSHCSGLQCHSDGCDGKEQRLNIFASPIRSLSLRLPPE